MRRLLIVIALAALVGGGFGTACSSGPSKSEFVDEMVAKVEKAKDRDLWECVYDGIDTDARQELMDATPDDQGFGASPAVTAEVSKVLVECAPTLQPPTTTATP